MGEVDASFSPADTVLVPVLGLTRQSLPDALPETLVDPNSAITMDQVHIAHPIEPSLQALITSEQEWTTLTNATRSTPRSLIENSYTFIPERFESAESSPAETAQPRCNVKEDPAEAPPVEAGEAAEDIPNLDPSVSPPPTSPDPAPADSPASAEPVESKPVESEPVEAVENEAADAPEPDAETPAATVDAVDPAPAAPSDDPFATPSSELVPGPTVRSGSEPLRDPSVDPSNYTPEGETPTPFDGSRIATLESLPDGSYRYLAGNFETRAYTDEALRENGGSIFLLTKVGTSVTGTLMPRLGLPGVCVTGTLSGDTITGAAYPGDTADIEQESAREVGDAYEPYGSGALQIRQSRTVGDRTYYAGAQLDLSNFSRINAGSTTAPTACDSPAVEETVPESDSADS